jgi:hydrogenase-4 component B
VEIQALILVFLSLCGVGAAAACVLSLSRQGTLLAWVGCLGAVTLVWMGADALQASEPYSRPVWSLPGWGALTVELDHLSAVFLIITGLVLFPASIYAGGELRREPARRNERAFTVMMLGLYASIMLIVVAGDVLFFLFAWELMSVLSYLLIVCGGDLDNRRADAGYQLLAMGEAGTLAAAIGLLILTVHAGSADFTAMKASVPGLGEGARWSVFLLSLFGFGVKAGLVPVNVWLPRAYTAAPRGFAPVLAGATLNLGLYGILRVNGDLMPSTHVGPGLVALVIGTLSALVGILYATTENDLKTVLAHSSIENAGIVVAGFGAGSVFIASNHPVPAAIAFVASLYHLLNHSLYKTLLFFGAGVIEAKTGTRDMDRLGGLIKWMPWAALGFLVGTLSIAALPPFNGFVSEWLTLQTMLRSVELSSTGVKIVFALCGAGLALTAALAVTCFVKVFAMSFLGMRRSDGMPRVTDAEPSTLVSMALLAGLCLSAGVLPTYVIPALDSASRPLAGASAADALVPPFFASHPAHDTLPPPFVGEFHDLGAQVGQRVLPGRGLVVLHRGGAENPVVFAMSTAYMLAALSALLGLAYAMVRLGLTRGRTVGRGVRWDGGVRRLLPEMTYTATGFSNPVRVIFDAVFRPTTVEDTRETVAEHFRTAIRREKARVHLVDKLMLLPLQGVVFRFADRLAAMHHGRINTYAAYVLLTMLAALVLALY